MQLPSRMSSIFAKTVICRKFLFSTRTINVTKPVYLSLQYSIPALVQVYGTELQDFMCCLFFDDHSNSGPLSVLPATIVEQYWSFRTNANFNTIHTAKTTIPIPIPIQIKIINISI
jgi:hypothetical protein